MHYIYKITNKINGKIYIGQTNDPSDRWSKHKSAARRGSNVQLITKSMTKYGVDNFIFEVIATCKTLQDANLVEPELIKQYNSRDPSIGYNVGIGGDHELHTPEIRAKIADSLRKHYSIYPSKSKGRKLSKEWKDKLSISATGKPGTNKGKKFSKEWARNISKALSLKENKKCRRFTDKVEKKICSLYLNKNYSIYKIAKHYNCYGSVISAVLDRNKIKKRQSNYSKNSHRRYRFDQQIEKDICNLYLTEDLSRTAIGKKFGCRTNVITSILKRNNII